MNKGTVLVTGASAGIGEAIVRRFAADGWRVVAAARRVERLQALAAELGDQVLPFALDVTDRAAVHALPASLPAPFNEIDVLVNNAGLALGREPAQQVDLDDWETMIAANVSGLVRCTHALLPGMVARGRGHVVNLGSIAGENPYPGGNVYGATKAFVRQLTRGLKSDLFGTPVRCTVVEPGMVETEFSQVRFKGDSAKARAQYASTEPMQAEDIAEAVAWAVGQPARVNVMVIQLLPTRQAFGPTLVDRKA